MIGFIILVYGCFISYEVQILTIEIEKRKYCETYITKQEELIKVLAFSETNFWNN